MMTRKTQFLELETSEFVNPDKLNYMGNMHGGEIMKLMDNTAGILSAQYSRGNAVTAAVNDISFLKGIPTSSIVKCKAKLTSVGRSSMKIKVEVFVEQCVKGEKYKAAEGQFVCVAVDENGRSRAIEPELDKQSV